MRRSLLASVLAPLLAPAALWGAIEGRVVSSSGDPVEHARVQAADGDGGGSPQSPPRGGEGESAGEVAFTDRRGRFHLAGVTPPAVLRVTHPRFEEVRLAVEAPSVEIALTAKPVVEEEIVVTGTAGGDPGSPSVLASTVVEPARQVGSSSSLAGALREVPGVSENGQGGLFQVVSIRGVSGQRVLTQLSGMRLTSERRAGVAASFLDPQLVGSVDVLRGPASSHYGTGALGGVLQLFPRRFEGWSLHTGYASAGGETVVAAGWGRPGDEGFSVGLARRRAGDSRTPGGALRPSGFEQRSAILEKRWREGGRRWRLLAVPAAGRDIGKPNTDFPERTTTYPEENHLLLRLAVAGEGWDAAAWAHPHDLRTRTTHLDGRREEVDNRTLDLGGGFHRSVDLAPSLAGRVGVDYFVRRGVDATERDFGPGEPPEPGVATLEGGREDEAAVAGSLTWTQGRVSFTGGGRHTRLWQGNAGLPLVARSAWSGYVGAVTALPGGLELTAHAGSALRFPGLSERFFSGSTGRGAVVANRDLEPERSASVDLGLRFYGEHVFVVTHLFRTRVRDYVERIEVAPDLLTFVNLTAGTLAGLETEGVAQLTRRFRLAWGGHRIRGRAAGGGRLADVPPDRAFATLRYEPPVRRWEAALRGELRGAVGRPASGERAIPGVALLAASLGVRLAPELELTVSGRNLLDREHFASADRKAVPEPGRSLGIALTWSGGAR